MADIKTEPVRLDHAMERLMVGEASPVDAAQLRHFEEMLDWGRHPPGFGLRPEGLSEQIFDAIMPQLRDARILQSSRYLSALRDLEALFSGPDHRRDELMRVAVVVLREEVQRHLLLRQHLNALVDS